jgi:hypothetical protein
MNRHIHGPVACTPRRWSRALAFAAAIAATSGLSASSAAQFRAASTPQIHERADKLQPGDVLDIDPGDYAGELYLHGLRGTPTAPITIRGRLRNQPPNIRKGQVGLRLSGCHYIRVQNLRFSEFTRAAIRIDDDNAHTTPSSHILLEHISVRESNPHGTNNAIELIDVGPFIIRDCQFESWGGAAIDIVGSREGLVEACTFTGRDNRHQLAGVRVRGGTSNIVVQSSLFRWAGLRSMCIGGTSTPEEFRPHDATREASAILVTGNRFIGSPTPVDWVNADGGQVVQNTFILPQMVVVGIHQETSRTNAEPCGNGVFAQNVIVLDERIFRIINVSEGTHPASFRIQSNAWHRVGPPRPIRLLVPETDGRLIDPQILLDGTDGYRVRSEAPELLGLGADACIPVKPPFVLPPAP